MLEDLLLSQAVITWSWINARNLCGSILFHAPRAVNNFKISNGTFFWYGISRKLQAHNSCVNTLAFSSGEGRFLASGGDGTQRFRLPNGLVMLTVDSETET